MLKGDKRMSVPETGRESNVRVMAAVRAKKERVSCDEDDGERR